MDGKIWASIISITIDIIICLVVLIIEYHCPLRPRILRTFLRMTQTFLRMMCLVWFISLAIEGYFKPFFDICSWSRNSISINK